MSSTIVTAFGAIGELFGGLISAAVAAGSATPVVLFVKSLIAEHIHDADIRSGINDAFTSQEAVDGTVKYVLGKVARGVITSGSAH